MTLDLWSLGLQAVNVAILVWLLSRVFWRPIAAAIANRQKTAADVIEAAQATQAKADAALKEATQAREGIAAEHATMRDAALAEAKTATRAALEAAETEAKDLLDVAEAKIRNDTDAAKQDSAAQASELSLKIAARLLARLTSPSVQSAFLTQLVDAIAKMPASERAALVADPGGIDIVSAVDMGARRAALKKAVQTALGGTPDIRIAIDPDLIGGLELRGAHFVLHNSWQADLMQVRKAVQDAA